MTVRVVVVDDQQLVRAGFVALIDAEPNLETVGQGGDGAAAVELVQRLHPDVVLMDVRMPGLDGNDASRRILADPGCADVRIIDLTELEADILALVSAGLTNTEIAGRLHLAVSTVKTYVSRLLDKLEVTTRTQLVIRAYESGFVEPGRG